MAKRWLYPFLDIPERKSFVESSEAVIKILQQNHKVAKMSHEVNHCEKCKSKAIY